MGHRAAPLAEMQEFCRREDLVHYAAMASRVGISGWMTQVEYTWFKPDTLLNDYFNVMIMKWPDEPNFKMHWVIVSIPIDFEERATGLLWQHGLRIPHVDDDKGPFTFLIIDHRGQHQFPLQGKTVRCLENHSAHHVAYTNDPEKIKAAREHEESQIIAKYHDEHRAWLNTIEGRIIARHYWSLHPEDTTPEPPYTGPPITPEEEKRWQS